MAGRDLRVPLDPLFRAFGVAVTVTPPGEDAIETTGVWVSPLTETWPAGLDLERSEPRHVLALRRDEVASVPRGTVVVAPEQGGGDDQTWRVDGIERVESDHHRVVLVPVS